MNQLISSVMALLTVILSVLGFPTNSTEDSPIDTEHGGDPFIIEAGDETFYTYTTGGGIDIKKIESFDNPQVLESKTVFFAGENGTIKDIWAPEIHKIGDRWYIISCAVFSKDTVSEGLMPEATQTQHDDFYRYAFVLESKTEDIFGEYEFKGILAPSGMNNIDGTYLKKDGKLYFVTSSYKDVGYQCITITEMENPYTLKTDENRNTLTAELSSPVLLWERNGWRVNEGPAVLYKDDNIFIVYSASGYSSGKYCLGMLTFNGDDVMNNCHWTKSLTRVLYHQPLKNIYNAGHCSFLYRENGDIYMIYHANTTKNFNDSPRQTFIRKVKFLGDSPVLS